jgi:hypothetical protein
MSTFNFEFNGQKFEVKAPAGVTFEQAKAVFDQQTASGGLTGFRVGDVLSPATQAAGGLVAAQSQLTQGLASLSSKLPAGTNLSSLTASIGTLGQGAGTQVASALQGGAASFNSLTTGASGATASISEALSAGLVGVRQRAGAAFNTFRNRDFQSIVSNESGPLGSSAITGAITGAAARAGSLASTAVGTLSRLIRGTPTAGINVADFAKQGPALNGIGNMSLPDVTGALAQASKLVGQGAGTISNALGAGKFGFDAGQLERAGLVKPGTAAAFLAAGENDLTSVLKSPTVWTGKDGVKGLDGLLSNSGLQDKVQQGLMKSGLDDLKSIGIPTDKLTPQALSGLATNAAKSVSDTANWAKNVPGLPADVKAKFDATAVNGAFAVNLTQAKVDEPVLQETKPVAADNTVNSATVDAAAKRVTGDERVPQVGGNSSSNSTAINAFSDFISSLSTSFSALKTKINSINQEYQTITQEQWNVINNEAVTLRATVRARLVDLNSAALKELDAIESQNLGTYTRNDIINTYNFALKDAKLMTDLSEEIRQLIKDLANKISVRASSNSYSGAG